MNDKGKQAALPRGTVLHGSTAYVIEDVLGIGGFGITYLATKEETWVNGSTMRRRVAVKEHFFSEYSERAADGTTVRTADTGRIRETVDGSLEDFLAEARRLQTLADGNANIVKVFDVFRANGTAYYVMEYLEGISLGAAIAGRPLAEADMLAVMKPIVDTVAFLHSRRINHLDIKPDNIVLTEGGRCPVLIDFGQSKHFRTDGSSTSTVNVKGATAGFAPAEQYDGIRTFSPTADVYALGATMMACLTGKTPPSALTWLHSAKARAIDVLPVSEATKAVITRALSADPAERYPDAGAMARGEESSSLPKAESSVVTMVDDNKTKEVNLYWLGEPKLDKKRGNKSHWTNRKWVLWGSVAVFILEALWVGYPKYEEYKTEQKRIELAHAERIELDSLWRSTHSYSVPQNLYFVVGLNGNEYYLPEAVWDELTVSQKGVCKTKGIVIDKDGQRFILGLDCIDGGHAMTWNEAMLRYGDKMPTKEQGEAITSQSGEVVQAINAFGGTDAYAGFWTNTEYDSSNAWLVAMANGGVLNRTKTNSHRARAVAPVAPSSAM